MHSSADDRDVRAKQVIADVEELSIELTDGRSFRVPYSRIATLASATTQQRSNFEMIGRGDGIHWPDIDEDLSTAGLFRDFGGGRFNDLNEIPHLIASLYRITKRLENLFTGRPFTPDGHLVGSIGEVVAEFIYDLVLEPCSTSQIDGRTRQDGRSVQIKLTGKEGMSYGFRWSAVSRAASPELLICLKLTESGFEEIYAGDFPVDLLEGRPSTSNGQLGISVSKLLSRNPRTIPQANSLAYFNEQFRSKVKIAA